MMALQPRWYDKHMSRAKEFDPSSLVLDRPIAYTSNLYSDVPLRDITVTEKERSEHTRRSEGNKKHTTIAHDKGNKKHTTIEEEER